MKGTLKSWHGDWGLVRVNRREQYFLHTTNITEGPDEPLIGSSVLFEIAPPYKNGKLPQAVNASFPLADVAVTEAEAAGAKALVEGLPAQTPEAAEGGAL